MSRKAILIFVGAFLLSGAPWLHAQPSVTDSLVRRGDALRKEYRFDESLEAYLQALEQEQDSLARIRIEEKRILSANGKSMAGYVYTPVVVARHRFSADDFFLYYPFREGSWREVPNQLDSIGGHPFARGMYVPEGAETIYYSAEDQEGVRNIYKTVLGDSLWTVPVLLNEQLTSDGDEVYPVPSSDGKSLYFSSAGLYGVGGYDIYVSRWDDDLKDWGAPENLGFPYSSPADDFLYMDTEDGLHTIFASNRDCSADSMWVYVLEYDTMPVRKEIDDPEELREISHLRPVDLSNRTGETSALRPDIYENEETRRYSEISAKARGLNDSLAICVDAISKERVMLESAADENERQRIADRITAMEINEMKLRRQLEAVKQERRALEEEFLFSGVVIDTDELMKAAEHEAVGELTNYMFTKMHVGEALHLDMAVPLPKFDYSFKILPEGQFAEDNTIPQGVVYQIQIFSTTTKAKVRNLRGLSPVFEHRNNNGYYVYRAGLFNAYNDALSNINRVKKAGFRNAYIVAYIDGKEVKVSKARAAEAARKKAEESYLYEVRIYPSGGEVDPVMLDGLVQRSSGRDVACAEDEQGTLIYMVGPFSAHSKAKEVAEFAEAMGIGKVVVKKMPKPSGN